jgi:streptogramin lyase
MAQITVAVVMLGISLAFLGSPARAENRQLIEWPLPPATGPGEIFPVSDKRIYFTEFLDSRLGALDPADNKFTEWSFPGEPPLDPFGLVQVGGDLLFAAGNTNQIMRLNPLTNTVKAWTVPTADSMPDEVALSGSKVYFTEFRGNNLAALDLNTDRITEWNSPVPASNRSRLSGVAVTADGTQVYFTQGDRIGTLDVGTNTVALWQMPGANRLSRVKVAEDGDVVAGDALAGIIVRLDPRTNTITTWTAPTAMAMISDVALRKLSADSSSGIGEPMEVGFTEDGVNKVGKLLTAKEPGTDTVVKPSIGTVKPVSNQTVPTAISAVRSTSTIAPTTSILPTVVTGGFEEWAIPAAVPHPSLIRLAFFGDDGLVFTESLAARIGLLR